MEGGTRWPVSQKGLGSMKDCFKGTGKKVIEEDTWAQTQRNGRAITASDFKSYYEAL